MFLNSNLHKAKAERNDEYYTQYSDIEKQVQMFIEYNPDIFKDKVILCPCDDYEWSNFTKYFADNFYRFKLKKLICTCYAKEPVINLENDFDGNEHDFHGKIFVKTHDNVSKGLLKGNGDFVSDEITNIAKDVDFIITNPPFSLFRKFMQCLFNLEKQFLVLGPLFGIDYKENFEYYRAGKVWIEEGFTCASANFIRPDGTLMNAGNARWFSNIFRDLKHVPLKLQTLKENQDLGIKYENFTNYNGLNVPNVMAIPSDYLGVMGVPITILDKINFEQFEIVGHMYGDDGVYLTTSSKMQFRRILIKYTDSWIKNHPDDFN